MSIQVSTIAGCGKKGFQDGKAENAMLNNPTGICIAKEEKVYFSDYSNHSIRLLSDGIVSTVAGCGKQGFEDGKAENAMFNGPSGICVSDEGNLYVSDGKNYRIRMISNGLVSTIAGCGQTGFQDGIAEQAMFNMTSGICISDEGSIYVSDSHNNRIRMISNGMVSTIAGCGEKGHKDGKAGEAMFNQPGGLCMSDDGKLIVSDTQSHRIRIISDGRVSTFAGSGESGFQDGKVEDATFDGPGGICISSSSDIYISDWNIDIIRRISDGIVSIIAGGENGYKDGKAEDAMFNWPHGICISEDGQIYVADRNSCRIRMISGLPIPPAPFQYFGLSSLLNESKSLSDMTLTINNHQYHLHTAVVHALCPMVIKHISIIEDAKISHESLQTMFEMIYSNNTTKIRKSKPDQYQMTELTHLIELIWLFESFEIKNRSFITICIKQLKTQMKYFMEHDGHNSTIETLKNDLIQRTDELIALSQLHGLQTTKLVQINHFINQNNKQDQNLSNRNNNEILSMSMHDMFLLFGLHTEPRVVVDQQIKSVIAESQLKTQPDYTIMIYDRSYQIKCHKLILYGKWSYFRRMIESGLLESASGEMIMSEDWNATRLYDFVKYLYTHEVGFESIEDCRWLLDNAELYELMQKQDFNLLIDKCRKNARMNE